MLDYTTSKRSRHDTNANSMGSAFFHLYSGFLFLPSVDYVYRKKLR